MQETPESRTPPRQQAALPPGRELQPEPPQLPQLAAQQTLLLAMPLSQPGSENSRGLLCACCDTVAICVGLKKPLPVLALFGQPDAEQ